MFYCLKFNMDNYFVWDYFYCRRIWQTELDVIKLSAVSCKYESALC